jgi:hypothetical protein
MVPRCKCGMAAAMIWRGEALCRDCACPDEEQHAIDFLQSPGCALEDTYLPKSEYDDRDLEEIKAMVDVAYRKFPFGGDLPSAHPGNRGKNWIAARNTAEVAEHERRKQCCKK